MQCAHSGCQEEFEPKRVTHRFCGKKCRERDWVENNRESHRVAARKYRKDRYEREGRWRDEGEKAKKLKAWMLEVKSAPCTDCDKSFDACCMDFDHVSSPKLYNVASMFAHHYSREKIEAEIAKCELVCANCHRIRTRDRRTGSGGQNGI